MQKSGRQIKKNKGIDGKVLSSWLVLLFAFPNYTMSFWSPLVVKN